MATEPTPSRRPAPATSLYEPGPDGSWVAHVRCASPWGPDSLHGGAAAALLAGLVDEQVSDAELGAVARLSVRFVRPVPFAPLFTQAATTQRGRRVSTVEASLALHAPAGHHDALVVATARALCIRHADVRPLPAAATELPPTPEPGPEHAPHADAEWWGRDREAFHTHGMELRLAEGAVGRPGPATVWARLRHTVTPGRAPTPLQRVAAAADFGNGASMVLPPGWLFVNPDLDVTLARRPDGEWIALAARTLVGPAGAGVAVSRLFDAQGWIGEATQTLVVDRPAEPDADGPGAG